MNCCVSLAGIVRDCDTNIGGIKKAWIACYDDVTSVTVTNDEITAITLATGAEGFKEYEFRKQTGSVTTTITIDDAAGTLFFDSAIVLQFSKQETAKRIEIAALAQSDVVVIIEDNNGKYWYFGYSFPVSMSDGTGETGTAFTDFNGYNITLSDFSTVYPYEVTEAAVEAVLGDE